jgi:hypothetical protein
MTEPDVVRRFPRWKTLLLTAAGLLAAFAVGGFFVAPPFVKTRLLRELSRRLGREVTIGAIAVNPFELSLTVRDLAIKDRDGAPFASWTKAVINYRFTSFLTRNQAFDEMSFYAPYARFVIDPKGGLNVDDLLKIFRASPPGPASGPPPVWSFDKIHVEGARVGFTDQTRSPAFDTTIGPFRLDLERFSTKPDEQNPYAFNGSTESGETFAWTGRFQTDPLTSSGTFTLGTVRLPKYRPYYEHDRPFHVRDGKVSMSASYELRWTPIEKVMRLKGANLKLEEAKIERPGSAEPDIEAGTLTVENADVDVMTGAASIGRIALDGGKILIRHDRDGKVNLYEMIRPFVEAPRAEPAAAAAAAAPVPPAAPLTIGALSVAHLAVTAEDLQPARPFRVEARDVAFTMTGIDGKPETRCPATLSAKLGDAGRIDVKGTFTSDFHKGDLDVDVAGADLRATDVYVDPVASVRFVSGRVGGTGHVTYEMRPHDPLYFHYAGSLTVEDLAAADADKGAELLRFSVLKIAPLEVRLNPLSVAIGEIALGAPRIRLVLAPDRTMNLTQVLRHAQEPDTPAPVSPADRGPLPDVRIGTIRVRDGSATLDDHSVEPTVSVSLSHFGGTIEGVSTAELARAKVDLATLFDEVAPVTIKGQINPVAQKDFTDLLIEAKGVDIVTFSPYTGKWLGQGLAKGKLAAKLDYKVAERRFKSQNLFTIDQFELGEKTESPDAHHLPLKLAVAVLRDSNGRIVLDVPAEGSLDDPEFRWGRVIARAIVNVLTKIVTSPFRMLAGAFGGKDQNVEVQEFAPGRADLADAEKAKLDVVAKSLAAKPELSLEIHGETDPDLDAVAIKRQRLGDAVREQKWKALRSSNPALASPDAVTVGPEDYSRWLKAAYDAVASTGGTAQPAAVEPSTETMEAAVLDTITVGGDDLRQLATSRAKAVRDYLATTGQVPAERLFLADAAPAGDAKPAPRVRLELKTT